MYTLDELKELLNEFHTNHPLLHKRQIYEQGRDIEKNGAANFLWWLEHNKEYNVDHNWSYGSF